MTSMKKINDKYEIIKMLLKKILFKFNKRFIGVFKYLLSLFTIYKLYY